MQDEHEKQVTFGWSGVRRLPRAPKPEESQVEPGPQTRGRSSSPTALAPLPPDHELWDVHAAARFLKRSVSWVYHRVEDGTLPAKRLAGWGVRFIPAELRAWVETCGAGPRGR